MSRANRSLSALVVFVCSLCFGTAALAQTTSATLRGTVHVDGAETVADAVILARSEDTGELRTSVTDAKGRYRLEGMSPGMWTVSARLPSGQVSEPQAVGLRLQQTVQLDFRITGGKGLSEHVTVTADAALIDPKETAGKLQINRQQADALPLSGRVFTDLALLDSSVGSAPPGVFFGERGSVMVVNGQSGRSNSFLVDGLDNNDHVSGTTSNSFYSQQVIEDFVLVTEQYSPEFGRASGGVMNIVTRRGANDLSWEVFLQGSAGAWNESGDFMDSLPDTNGGNDTVGRFYTGFNFGGAFKKEKAFYFVAYEHQRNDNVIPYTGVTSDGVTGGKFDARSTDNNLFFRTDFNLGNANTLMLRLSADARRSEGINVGGIYTPESGFAIDEQDFSLAGTLTSIVSPTLINEFRFLAATSAFDQQANSDLPGVTRPSGIFGGNPLNLQLRDEDRFQLVENLTWQNGPHTFKAGLDVTHSRTDIATAFNPNGTFGYDTDMAFEPGDCGNLFSFLVRRARENHTWPIVPCPGQVNVDDDGDGEIDEPGNILSYPTMFQYISGKPSAELTDTKIALFAQDHWEIGSRLVLDYGLRYDVSTFTLPEDARVDSTVPNGGAGRDTDNLAPRLGFTYQPKADGRLVIRGGGGLFYDKMVLGFAGVSAITSGTEIGLFFPQGLTWETTEETVQEEGIDTVLDELFFPETLVMRFTTAPELETPYTVQFNLGLDMRIGQNGAFRANVVSNRGYRLPLMIDTNPVIGIEPPNSGLCPDDVWPFGKQGVPCHREDQTVGSMATLVTEGRSWYKALDLSYRWQKAQGWLSASYTWSKAEDMGFDPLKGGISLPPDSDDIYSERGLSDGDRRHRMVLSGALMLPWWGLNASGVLQLSTALPYNVTTGQDNNVDGIFTDRPAGVARNTGADTPIELINAYRDEYRKTYGLDDLASIENLEAPGFAQFDLRVWKHFTFNRTRNRGEVFVQVFNLFDRENPGLIEGRVISPNFGAAVTLAGPPRIIETGVKFGY